MPQFAYDFLKTQLPTSHGSSFRGKTNFQPVRQQTFLSFQELKEGQVKGADCEDFPHHEPQAGSSAAMSTGLWRGSP